jgi:hypothetical protein
MEQNDSANKQVDEDKSMKSQMEKMVPSYDSYMRKVTFGRERTLREITVGLADVRVSENIMGVAPATWTRRSR